MKRALLAIGAVILAAALPQGSSAQELEHERGKILSIDLDKLKVELSDAKGRVFTRSFAKDATVKFRDGARFFPTPSIRDLRPPMYVHYMFRNDVIEEFDVVELGYDPSVTPKPAAPGQKGATTSEGRVLRVSRRSVLIEVDGHQESYGVAEPQLLKKLSEGTTARFTWVEKDGRHVITEVR